MTNEAIKIVEEPVTLTLAQEVETWDSGRAVVGSSGLRLMLKIAEHMGEHRDWDAAARLLGRVKEDAVATSVFKLVLSSRFGNKLKLKTRGVKHTSGFEFEFATKDYIVPKNAFAIVMDAVDAGTSYTSKTFIKELRDAMGVGTGGSSFNKERYLKTVVSKFEKENVTLDEAINYLNKLRTQQKIEKEAWEKNIASRVSNAVSTLAEMEEGSIKDSNWADEGDVIDLDDKRDVA